MTPRKSETPHNQLSSYRIRIDRRERFLALLSDDFFFIEGDLVLTDLVRIGGRLLLGLAALGDVRTLGLDDALALWEVTGFRIVDLRVWGGRIVGLRVCGGRFAGLRVWGVRTGLVISGFRDALWVGGRLGCLMTGLLTRLSGRLVRGTGA